MHRIRKVGGHDDEIADALADLQRPTFFDGASIPEFERGGSPFGAKPSGDPIYIWQTEPHPY
jgi:hypothetical protein